MPRAQPRQTRALADPPAATETLGGTRSRRRSVSAQERECRRTPRRLGWVCASRTRPCSGPRLLAPAIRIHVGNRSHLTRRIAFAMLRVPSFAQRLVLRAPAGESARAASSRYPDWQCLGAMAASGPHQATQPPRSAAYTARLSYNSARPVTCRTTRGVSVGVQHNAWHTTCHVPGTSLNTER